MVGEQATILARCSALMMETRTDLPSNCLSMEMTLALQSATRLKERSIGTITEVPITPSPPDYSADQHLQTFLTRPLPIRNVCPKCACVFLSHHLIFQGRKKNTTLIFVYFFPLQKNEPFQRKGLHLLDHCNIVIHACILNFVAKKTILSKRNYLLKGINSKSTQLCVWQLTCTLTPHTPHTLYNNLAHKR